MNELYTIFEYIGAFMVMYLLLTLFIVWCGWARPSVHLTSIHGFKRSILHRKLLTA